MEFIEKIIKILKKIFFIKDEENCQKDFLQKNLYVKKEYLLTPTELIFYKVLKEVTDELNLIICPQVSLYEIVNSKEYKGFNKIARKTIDFVIAEPNLKIKCCIELDDYTHNRQSRIKRDNFINELFKNVGIKLFHAEVKQYYDKEKIKNAIMSV